MAKVIKEIIIMLLVCLLTMLVLAIALYRFIPNRKVVPEVVTYTASEEIQDLLDDNIDKKSDANDVISTYEVTASDLSGYQTTNVYVPGKSNPFAETNTSTSTSDGTSGENNSNHSENNNQATNSTTNNNNSSTNGSAKNETTSGNKQNTNPNESNESTTPSVYNKEGTK